MSMTVHDAVIIGGGPGGATAGAYLARAGFSVLLLEREKFPRFHIGESLLPNNLEIFDDLGVREDIEAAGFIQKNGAIFVTANGRHRHTFYFDSAFDPIYPAAFEVPRADFDNILLRHAERCGVEVREEHAVAGLVREGVKVAGVRAAGPDGREYEARGRMVLDASGQSTVLAKWLNLRRRDPRDHNRAAFFGHFQGVVREPGRDEGNIIICVAPFGWWWLIPFTGDRASVGVVVHDDHRRSHYTGDPEAFFRDILARTSFMAGRLRDARPVSPIRTLSNFSYVSQRYWGEDWMMVGDASAFIDPIFSTGVFLAMSSGRLAARAVTDILRAGAPRRRVLAAYEREVRRLQGTFKPFIYNWYDPAFAQLFFHPDNKFQLETAIISLLAADIGDPRRARRITRRVPIFFGIVGALRLYSRLAGRDWIRESAS
jgi:flavin-dependent dehydrogenase